MTSTPQLLSTSSGLTQRRGVSVIAALASGAVLFPTICFVGLIIAYGQANIGPGNLIFWGTVLAGSAVAGVGVFYSKRVPIWLATTSGLVVVLGAFSVLTVALYISGVI